MIKPYKDHVTLEEILRDGWSRGFQVEQTVEEASAMGHEISNEYVVHEWYWLNVEMEKYFDNNPYYENDDGWIET